MILVETPDFEVFVCNAFCLLEGTVHLSCQDGGDVKVEDVTTGLHADMTPTDCYHELVSAVAHGEGFFSFLRGRAPRDEDVITAAIKEAFRKVGLEVDWDDEK